MRLQEVRRGYKTKKKGRLRRRGEKCEEEKEAHKTYLIQQKYSTQSYKKKQYTGVRDMMFFIKVRTKTKYAYQISARLMMGQSHLQTQAYIVSKLFQNCACWFCTSSIKSSKKSKNCMATTS